jgi:hypothetical protein
LGLREAKYGNVRENVANATHLMVTRKKRRRQEGAKRYLSPLPPVTYFLHQAPLPNSPLDEVNTLMIQSALNIHLVEPSL